MIVWNANQNDILSSMLTGNLSICAAGFLQKTEHEFCIHCEQKCLFAVMQSPVLVRFSLLPSNPVRIILFHTYWQPIVQI